MRGVGFGAAMAALLGRVTGKDAKPVEIKTDHTVIDTIKRWTGTEDLVINASSGRMRAARRLREHKAQWDNTPEYLPYNRDRSYADYPSRQVRRRSRILQGRQIMTVAKAQAAKTKGFLGGSAAINTPLDAMNFLG